MLCALSPARRKRARREPDFWRDADQLAICGNRAGHRWVPCACGGSAFRARRSICRLAMRRGARQSSRRRQAPRPLRTLADHAPQPPQYPGPAVHSHKSGTTRQVHWKSLGNLQISLMWPRNHCIDQFAALDEVVQGGASLYKSSRASAIAANSGRCLRRLCHRRFG